jgi:hypothetical protein
MKDDFTIEEVVNFFRKNRVAGSKSLEQLEKVSKNISVNFNTDIGREILLDDINKFNELLEKIIREEETPQEKAEFRVIRGRLDKLNQRLNVFLKSIGKIRESSNA